MEVEKLLELKSVLVKAPSLECQYLAKQRLAHRTIHQSCAPNINVNAN